MARKNEAASVKQRLLDLPRARREDFNLVLTRYAVERLLYRLCRAPEGNGFILKGAALFLLWSDVPHRPTRDLDLLGTGHPGLERLQEVFRAICGMPVDGGGLVFEADSVQASRIREEDEYQGVRLVLQVRLGRARLPVQVDVGFGDSVVPPPDVVDFPVLLDHPVPRLRAYRRETVIAEKFQWRAFLRRSKLDDSDVSSETAVEDICRFLIPVLEEMAAADPHPAVWPPGGPWQAVPRRP